MCITKKALVFEKKDLEVRSDILIVHMIKLEQAMRESLKKVKQRLNATAEK